MAEQTLSYVKSLSGSINAAVIPTYPKITLGNPATWSKNASYPAWAMVVGSDGTTYFSLQEVPAGTIELTNTDYWQPGPSGNAQFSLLDTRIGDLEAEYIYPTMTKEEINTILSTKSRIVFMPGEYNIIVPDTEDDWFCYRFFSNCDITMLGAKFVCKQKNKDGSFPFLINVSENIRVHGSWELVGDIDYRDSYVLTSNTMQSGVYISTSHNITIEGLIVHHMYGDGISTDGTGEGSECSNITIRDCEVYTCLRNGMSLMNQVDTMVINCSCHDIIYDESIYGLGMGIDIEPSYPDTQVVKRNSIIGCTFYGNGGAGIGIINQGSTDEFSVVVSGCHIDGMAIRGYSTSTIVNVSNCTIDATSDENRPCVNCSMISNPRINFTGCIFSTLNAVLYDGYEEQDQTFPRLKSCTIERAAALIYFERYNPDRLYYLYFSGLTIPNGMGKLIWLQTGEFNGYVYGDIEATTTQIIDSNADYNPLQNVVINRANDCNLNCSKATQWSVPFTVVNAASNALTLTGARFMMDGSSNSYASVPANSSVRLMFHPSVGAIIKV